MLGLCRFNWFRTEIDETVGDVWSVWEQFGAGELEKVGLVTSEEVTDLKLHTLGGM